MFATLKLGTLLHQAGIRKSFGLPALAVFQLIFTLVFQQRRRSKSSTTASGLREKASIRRLYPCVRLDKRSFISQKRFASLAELSKGVFLSSLLVLSQNASRIKGYMRFQAAKLELII